MGFFQSPPAGYVVNRQIYIRFMSGVVEESVSPGEPFNGNDKNSNSDTARILRRCSGPETAFNNISNNGGATIECVIAIDTGRPLECREIFSAIENLYNKYEILRLRFIFKQKVSNQLILENYRTLI